MDSKIEAVLAEYEAREAVEAALLAKMREGQPPPADFSVDNLLLPIGRAVGTMLNLLIKEEGCKTILEVGASYGNSTIWFAEAARAVGGKVISLELAQNKVDYAREMATKAGLIDHIEFIVGDAVAVIDTLSGPFDFVLIDLWKDLYVPVLDAVYPKLAENALIAADNMTRPPAHVADALVYRRHVRTKANIQSLLLNIGEGVELSRLSAPLG